MSEKTMNNEEQVMPIRLTDNDSGKVYELDFNRDAVRFAENRGFAMEDLTRYPSTKIPELFFYAFRKNHRNLARSQTDELLEKMGGLSSSVLERLGQLYQQAALTYVIADEDEAKNPSVTVEL